MSSLNSGFHLGILTEPHGWEKNYISACEELGVKNTLIDILANDWWERVKATPVDGYLVRAAGDNETRKQLYNERLWFIIKEIKKPIYPSYTGILLYENKRMQSYWMSINDILHPKTYIYYRKEDALSFIDSNRVYPLLSKPNLGGGGEGVRFLNSEKTAKRIIKKVFTRYKFFNPGLTRWRQWRGIKLPVMDDKQHNYLIFQEYIPTKWEWRIIKAGNSYFGHKKLLKGKSHSGSGLVEHVDPPKELFELVKEISIKSGIRSLNVDILEGEDGKLYVNEIQTFWGGKKQYQMKINDESCRYVDNDKGVWELEYGIFHRNRGCNLRVADFIEQLKEMNLK